MARPRSVVVAGAILIAVAASWLSTVSVAPGTIAPLGSTTVISSRASRAVCAAAGAAATIASMSEATRAEGSLFMRVSLFDWTFDVRRHPVPSLSGAIPIQTVTATLGADAMADCNDRR